MPRKTPSAGSLRNTPSACFNEAAARCRGKPRVDRPLEGAAEDASMRPRPDAAENLSFIARPGQPAAGFNEAAARCRGKPCDRCHAVAVAEKRLQ